MVPYRDELTAARSRIDVLEHALRERLCERCAVKKTRSYRRPLSRALLAMALAVLTGTMGVVTTTSIWGELHPHGRMCRRTATD
jgi:hypothetical protein